MGLHDIACQGDHPCLNAPNNRPVQSFHLRKGRRVYDFIGENYLLRQIGSSQDGLGLERNEQRIQGVEESITGQGIS